MSKLYTGYFLHAKCMYVSCYLGDYNGINIILSMYVSVLGMQVSGQHQIGFLQVSLVCTENKSILRLDLTWLSITNNISTWTLEYVRYMLNGVMCDLHKDRQIHFTLFIDEYRSCMSALSIHYSIGNLWLIIHFYHHNIFIHTFKKYIIVFVNGKKCTHIEIYFVLLKKRC